MTPPDAADVWASGDAYEPYIGRWSRAVARKFLDWLDVPASERWLDVGCGTGALSEVILEVASPAEVVGIDPSADYVAHARAHVADPRARFAEGDARALPVPSGAFDAVVSGLVLNFVPDPAAAATEMARAARPGGTVGAYVWDYAGGMALIRRFWDAAVALDPTARELDEGLRFAALCHSDALTALFRAAGLRKVDACIVGVPTLFRDFDDFWMPFLGGQGPAPGYAMGLSEERRAALRERIRADLPIAADGSIALAARAWAVRGERVVRNPDDRGRNDRNAWRVPPSPHSGLTGGGSLEILSAARHKTPLPAHRAGYPLGGGWGEGSLRGGADFAIPPPVSAPQWERGSGG